MNLTIVEFKEGIGLKTSSHYCYMNLTIVEFKENSHNQLLSQLYMNLTIVEFKDILYLYSKDVKEI